MLFTPATPAAARGHIGYLAGRYRDGAYSDEWTDVRRCAPATFTAHAPACSCGWRGAPQPMNPTTPITCARRWHTEHLTTLDPATTGLTIDDHPSLTTPSALSALPRPRESTSSRSPVFVSALDG